MARLTPLYTGVMLRRFCAQVVLAEEISVIVLALAGNAIQLVPDGTLLFHLVLIIVMVAC